ncbi:MAG: DUF4350 domain-containing protein [Deltaproteobacteria bacterium]|nr:MAG: DUF4350 domain-containing protein [Deltaproteobacteria bacterium]
MRITLKLAAAIFLTIAIISTAYAQKPLLLFDEGHGQRFTIDGGGGDLSLSAVAEVFSEAGFDVRAIKGKVTSESLKGVKALVTSGAFVPYAPDELKAINGFLEEGGSLALMLHISPTVRNLMDILGVVPSNGVLKEGGEIIGGKDIDFKITNLEPHPLTQGLEYFSLYGGWALLPNAEGVVPIAATGESAWIDLNRNTVRDSDEVTMKLDVAVAGTRGRGRFVVFGDDAIFQNRFLDENNKKLARNLANWFLAELL